MKQNRQSPNFDNEIIKAIIYFVIVIGGMWFLSVFIK